jgi:nucleotide-binding universal stress UspA family protein
MPGPLSLAVALDFRPQTTGAIQYALWVCKAAILHASGHVSCVHVIEPEAFVELSRSTDERTMIGAFRQRGKELLDELAHGEHLHAPEVVIGDVYEEVEAFVRRQGATALVISRRAQRQGGLTLTRLGTVARRLLRRLAQPTIVAPPDLLMSQVGTGPVVVAVDFTEDSVRAVEWARSFAETIGRPIRLVHFVDVPDPARYAGMIHADRWSELSDESLGRGRERMREFVEKHRFGDVDTDVVSGPVLPEIVDYASAAGACLLVTGSGHHGMMYRLVVPSVASETAAMSTVAVAVVP